MKKLLKIIKIKELKKLIKKLLNKRHNLKPLNIQFFMTYMEKVVKEQS